MQKAEKFNDLVERYELALKAYGLSVGSRLNKIARANVIIRRHENLGKEEFDTAVIADYFNEIDQKHLDGEIKYSRWKDLRREAERILQFVQTGEVKLINPAKGPQTVLSPYFERIAADFLSRLDYQPSTLTDARWSVYKYFSWLEKEGFRNLQGVDAVQIQSFMLFCSQNYVMGSVSNIRLYLARLYDYLFDAGLSESNHETLLTFAVSYESRLQPTLQKDEVAALLNSIDRNTKMGKRNYAIMILGAVLGLRADDIINLKLPEIDWVNGEIKIFQTKTGQTVVLPLTCDVGEPLQDYILNVRPKAEYNQVFIRLNAPFTPLKSATTVGEIYRNCCKAAEFEPHKINKRFHTLRRTLGTSMVTSGTQIGTVAQVLGHTDIDSTKKYISLDSEHLKMCALSFDGIAPENKIGGESA